MVETPSTTQSYQQQSLLNQRLAPLRSVIYNALMTRIDPNAAIQMTSDELTKETQLFVADYVISQGIQINKREQQLIATDIVNDMVGFGPLELALQDDEITDIMVNGPDKIYVERRGKLEKSWLTFRNVAHIMQVAQRIANRVGRRVDESSPMVDARLPDGSRVNVIVPPVSLDGPVISIRKFAKRVVDISQMVRQGNISPSVAEFIEIAMKCRLNILIAGGTGTGKTTFLNAISSFIDSSERILTIEDAAELRLQQPHVVRLETRPPNIEGRGEVAIRQLVRNALRMRPDRIIVGEVRGEETVDMLQAMNTGHDGSMSTIHANRAEEALNRLENMITISDAAVPGKVIRAQIAGGLDLIVHLERMRDGVRRVTEIVEVVGIEEEDFILQTLFKFHFLEEDASTGSIRGEFKPGSVLPSFMDRARYYGLDQKLEKLFKGRGK
jgi:pilus assembly protein CpaF